MPTVTALYTGLCILLLLFLALRVVVVRRRERIGLGTGGSRGLEQRVRAHANATEYLPVALVGLLLVELSGYPSGLVHALGLTLLVSRAAHAWGLAQSAGTSLGRFWGTFGTWLMLLVTAAALVWRGLPL